MTSYTNSNWHEDRGRRLGILLIVCLAVSFVISGCSSKDAVENQEVRNLSELKVHFLDVGKADAILVQFDDQFMLVDTGLDETEDVVWEYLKDVGVSKLTCIVATHPDKDHIGGADMVLLKVPTERLLVSPISKDSSYYEAMMRTADMISVPVEIPQVGDSWQLGEASVTVIGPGEAALETEDKNEGSLILYISYRDVAFLLMGDAKNVSEKELMRSGFDISADVIKVGHHGSKKASSFDFVKKVSPQIAVISCGYKKGETLPDSKTLDTLMFLGVRTYRTDLDGTIVVSTDGEQINVMTENPRN